MSESQSPAAEFLKDFTAGQVRTNKDNFNKKRKRLLFIIFERLGFGFLNCFIFDLTVICSLAYAQAAGMAQVFQLLPTISNGLFCSYCVNRFLNFVR